MASVGERLRLVRESRNMSIEDMVVATGIGQSYLEAVERDEIHELPGKAFGKLYIRAYAEVFGFDPQPWIDAYDREQRVAAGASTEPVAPVPAGARPVAAAIARWKESRAAADGVTSSADETATVESSENLAADAAPIVEPVATEPEPPPEAPPEAPPEVRVVRPEVAVRADTGPAKAKRPIAAMAFAGVVVVALAIYAGALLRNGGERAVPAATSELVVQPVPEARPPEPPPPAVAATRAAPPAKPPVVRETPAGSLSVPEFGVGLRIVNSRLEGERTEFTAGQVACFQTRVVGGTRGDSIRHVWIYDGRAQQSITLRLGGPDWRTHTNKTLYKTGPWTVEARDRNGRALATATLSCVPTGR